MSIPVPWLRSSRFDGVFFIGSALIAGLIGALLVRLPTLLVPTLWVFLLLVEGPHLLATWQRTVFDPAFDDPAVARVALLAGVAPLVLFGISWVVPAAIDLLLAWSAVWSIHHVIRQHHGVVALYDARAAAPSSVRAVDRWALQVGLWALVVASQFLLPLNRRVVGVPDAVAPLGWVAVAVGVACGLALLGRVVWAWRGGVSALPGLIALGPILAFTALVTFGLGAFEPVYAAASNPEQQLLAVAMVGGMFHGVQYLGIVALTNPVRFAGRAGLVGRLGRSPLRSWAMAVVLCAGWVLINAARADLPGWVLFEPGSHSAHFFLALYWGVFFHHYALDGRIWRVRQNPALRQEFGLS